MVRENHFIRGFNITVNVIIDTNVIWSLLLNFCKPKERQREICNMSFEIVVVV